MPTSYKYKLTIIHETDTYEVHPMPVEDTSYELQILLGTYIKGDKGDPGSDADVTRENIERALGYVPVSPSDLATKQDKMDPITNAEIDTMWNNIIGE